MLTVQQAPVRRNGWEVAVVAAAAAVRMGAWLAGSAAALLIAIGFALTSAGRRIRRRGGSDWRWVVGGSLTLCGWLHVLVGAALVAAAGWLLLSAARMRGSVP